MSDTLLVLFWILLFIIIYIYAGYPVLIFFLSNIFSKADKQHKKVLAFEEEFFPHISFFIPAYNEENVIKDKIENALQLKYPSNRIEIIVASDGSTDTTNKIISSYKDRIKSFIYEKRSGKTSLINKTVPKLAGDLIVFSDASAILKKDSLQKLIRHFRDIRIGCVSGQYKLKDRSFTSRAKGESLYWKYETGQ